MIPFLCNQLIFKRHIRVWFIDCFACRFKDFRPQMSIIVVGRNFKISAKLLDIIFKSRAVSLTTDYLIDALCILSTQSQGYFLREKCASYALTIIDKERYCPFIEVDSQYICALKIMYGRDDNSCSFHRLSIVRIRPTEWKVALH